MEGCTHVDSGEIRGQQSTLQSLFSEVGSLLGTYNQPLISFHKLHSTYTVISITASGTNTAGETYRLVCSVTVTGSTDQPTITWSDPMNNPVPSEMVNTTGSMSTLTFNPLSASHAGTYTCRATIATLSDERTVTVRVDVPGISAVTVCSSCYQGIRSKDT